MSPDASAVTASAGEPPALQYVARRGIFRIALTNTILNILTLSLYRFWARTRWRRHMWGNIILRGDPLEYHGTGFELFKGFLVALAVLAPSIGVLRLLGELFGNAGPYVTFVVFALLSVVAQFYAWRYRMSRTSWRGVRLRVEGRLRDYARSMVWTPAVFLLSGLLLYPHCRVRLRATLLSMTAFGERQFECHVRLRRLYAYWLVVWVAIVFCILWFNQYVPAALKPDGKPDFSNAPIGQLIVPAAIAVIAFVVYRVAEFRAIAAGTRLGEVTFASRASGLAVLGYVAAGILVVGIALAFGFGLWNLVLSDLVDGRTDRGTLAVIGIATIFVLYLTAYAIGGVIRAAWIEPWVVSHIVRSLDVTNADALDGISAVTGMVLDRGEGLADSFDVGIA
ncbi:MAG: DUF898 family protein [Alphaproteobacteria bacterium]|nr:DUF898 family protein [Alphaproteobacteria bacterium]